MMASLLFENNAGIMAMLRPVTFQDLTKMYAKASSMCFSSLEMFYQNDKPEILTSLGVLTPQGRSRTR